MRGVIIFLSLLVFASTATAWDDYDSYNSRPYKDYWGNHYKHYENMWKDSDRDGVINYFDYNDRNPYIQNPYQRNYFKNNWNKRYYRW